MSRNVRKKLDHMGISQTRSPNKSVVRPFEQTGIFLFFAEIEIFKNLIAYLCSLPSLNLIVVIPDLKLLLRATRLRSHGLLLITTRKPQGQLAAQCFV